MNNGVDLKFDKSLCGLAGYDFGVKTYEEQVKNKIIPSQKFTIRFPDNIQRIASSFIQGFFSKLVQDIGVSGIEKNLEIESAKRDMKETIIKNLL